MSLPIRLGLRQLSWHTAAASQQRLWAAGAVRGLAAAVDAETEVERSIAAKVVAGLPGAERVVVRDTSGGCGSMYSLEVVASEFRGQPTFKQHQAVAKIIKEDIQQWHGFTLVTKAPAAEEAA